MDRPARSYIIKIRPIDRETFNDGRGRDVGFATLGERVCAHAETNAGSRMKGLEAARLLQVPESPNANVFHFARLVNAVRAMYAHFSTALVGANESPQRRRRLLMMARSLAFRGRKRASAARGTLVPTHMISAQSPKQKKLKQSIQMHDYFLMKNVCT